MNLSSILKPVAIAVLALGVTIGCTQQQQKPAPAAEQPSSAAAAIKAAKEAYKKALAVGYAWRDTGKIIKKAEAALTKGDEEKALKLANKARFQGEAAVRQYNYEQGIDRSLPTEGGASSYTVERGDHLWGISGKDSVYGDPYQWPLIYRANSDKIKDADLIYPGQELDVDASPSSSDVSAAVNHAKTRGAWSLGAVESSDQAYLGQ